MPKRRIQTSDDDDTEDLDIYMQELEEDIRAALSARAGQSWTRLRFMTALRELSDDFETKRRKAEPPSFSNVLWKDVAPQFNLDSSKTWPQFDHLAIPNVSLPPSFHRKLMSDSASWLDVYQERGAQDHEAARVRLMEAWHVPVCGLFKGRLVDRPEAILPATGETSGGRVEHQVYTVEGILLEINELKFAADGMGRSEKDNFAQVLVSLTSAYKLNSKRGFDPQPPVYAILTDLRDFHFVSFDGSRFACTTPMTVPVMSRLAFLEGMVKVTEQFFSMLLQAFIQTLVAVEARSKVRGENGDISMHNSAREGIEKLDKSRTKVPRPSLEKWSKALLRARQAQEILVKCNRSSLQTWEEDGSKGLSALSESVSYLDIIGSASDLTATELANEIEKILSRQCSPNTPV